ncbi:MAG: relaxase/mobilization nuclease domain-containing protein [Burkholderiaceae bacterium]|jgi:hypothetical protein|nr:relaxase/mobilization nuclease domain-containing protein [Burkholderiaceae bacterium]
MIPTVLKSNRQSAPEVRFKRVVEYVGRDDDEARDKGQKPLTDENCGVFNMDADCATPQDRETLWQIMSGDAAQARYKGEPVYHFDVSWMEGEHPTREQLESTARHFTRGLGFGQCQTFWAVHRDTDNDHLHIIVNKVMVQEDGSCIVVEKPRFDYRVLARLAREVEIEQGWEHAPGYYVAVQTQAGDKEIMPRKEAVARGLWNKDWEKQKISRMAGRVEQYLGTDSFQTWVIGEPGRALYETLQQPGAIWERVHETLARYGVAIETKGSGLVVTTTLDDGRVLAAKASQIGKWASKAALEKRLGAYQPPSEGVLQAKQQAQHNYPQAVRAQRAGEQNPKFGENSRAVRKTEREIQRGELLERFESEQKSNAGPARKRQRDTLRERHQDERKTLKADLAGQRRQLFRAAKAGHRLVTPVELALHARQRALQLEALQKRQREERLAFSKSLPKRAATWRAWLEQQAGQDDAAAQAALRGIRYQEQRKKKQQVNAIARAVEEQQEQEQEQEQQIRMLTVARLRAEVDRRLQWVVYKSQDGTTRMVDEGHRIVVKDLHDDTLEAALRVAAAKYYNQITITGTAEFRERTARMAVQLGIGVKDDDLQGIVRDEREKSQKLSRTASQENRQGFDRRDPER